MHSGVDILKKAGPGVKQHCELRIKKCGFPDIVILYC